MFILIRFEIKFESWLKKFLYQLQNDNDLKDIIEISEYLKNKVDKNIESNKEFLSNEKYKKYLIDNLNEDFGIGAVCQLNKAEHKQKYLKYKEKYLALKKQYALMQ
jgi:hypothetical protein